MSVPALGCERPCKTSEQANMQVPAKQASRQAGKQSRRRVVPAKQASKQACKYQQSKQASSAGGGWVMMSRCRAAPQTPARLRSAPGPVPPPLPGLGICVRPCCPRVVSLHPGKCQRQCWLRKNAPG
eukprot:gene14779-biopygen6612